MKKFLIAGLMLASCSAFAAIPEGYEVVPEATVQGQTTTLANKTTGGVLSVSVIDSEGATAKVIATEYAKSQNCTGEIGGDDNTAFFENCAINGQSMNFMFITDPNQGKMVMFMANDKATEEEFKTFMQF